MHSDKNKLMSHLMTQSYSWQEKLSILVMWCVALLISIGFIWIVGDLVVKGLPHLSWSFLSDIPRDAGRAGGIISIMASTLLLLAVCLLVSVPISIGAAVFLSEFSRRNSWFSRNVRRSLDVLAGVPSIIFGLFGNAFFCIYLGMGFSILAGGLTLACMVLPILIRSTETGLRSVPQGYREAGDALGISRIAVVRKILLPAAMPGLMAGLTLGIGRALAETAALLFTSGYVDRMPESLSDSGRSLSVHIYDLAMNVPGAEGKAYASALVLIVILLAINFITFKLSNYWHHQKGTAHA